MPYILKILLKIKGLLIFLANGRACCSLIMQHGLMVRKGGDPVVTHGWFVCPTVSMVTTSHATGLEKTIGKDGTLGERIESGHCMTAFEMAKSRLLL